MFVAVTDRNCIIGFTENLPPVCKDTAVSFTINDNMTITTTFTNEMISPDIVRDLREKLGMTPAELADEAKVSEAEVHAYEAGEPSKFAVIHEIGSALKRRGAIFPKPR